MKATRLSYTKPLVTLAGALSGQSGGIGPGGQVPTSNGSNVVAWGSNVANIFSNSSNKLLGPDVNFLSGAGIAFSQASNTLTISTTGGGGGGGGGAPTTVDYLVGTADPNLSAEIVVGTTPGGELGGTWGSPTVDATHSGSAHHAQLHQAAHNSGGGDALKLDDLAAPDDNTDLNASTSAHGLMQKYPGGTTTFLRADGSFATPSGSVAFTDFTQDLGVADQAGTFTITGLSGLTADKRVQVMQTPAAIASKGNARDEPEMDLIQLTGYVVDATTIRCYWQAPSVVVGTYAFAYLVSA